MIRAILYLLAAGAVWLAEGFLFSYFLRFHLWQTALMAALYAVLFLLAVRLLLDQVRSYERAGTELDVWRYLSLAPILTVVVGSFASLPVLLLIAAVGKFAGT